MRPSLSARVVHADVLGRGGRREDRPPTKADPSVRTCGRDEERIRAAVHEIDQGAEFCEGHELDDGSAAAVPGTMVRRMLNQEEAAKLIRRIDRAIPRRPAAASVRAQVKRNRKA
jgi:hypothetical protein